MLRHIALLLADEPELAGAVTNALLGKDPDVAASATTNRPGDQQRLTTALGPAADPDIVEALELLYAGALVRAGMGYASYHFIADLLERSARQLLGHVDIVTG